MTLFSWVPFAAAGIAMLLAVVSLLRQKPSFRTWLFFAGMMVLAIGSFLAGLGPRATQLPDVLDALTSGFIIKSLVPAIWLGFSLTYSRADYRASLVRWRIPLAVVALVPIGLSVGFQQQLFRPEVGQADTDFLLRFSAVGELLNVVLLLGLVWILMNLEQTFRSAVGTMRWRIKFVVLGLAVIFGARIYVHTQALLYSRYDPHWPDIESSGLLIGCVFLIVAYARTRFAEIDVYPSRSVLRSSITVLAAGGYLFVVGVLANIVKRFGGAEIFQIQAFIVLMGMASLAVLVLSDRLRQGLRNFVGRHFKRAQHDSVRIWIEFSRRLANVKDQGGLCVTSAKLISDTFEVLSVSVWLLDEQKDQLVLGASTALEAATSGASATAMSSAVVAGLQGKPAPFDLELAQEPWAGELRDRNGTDFPNGGNRWCVPLRAGEQILGTLVLADRVNGTVYSGEELQLLQCIADDVTSVLLNLRLANEVARSREMEAFRTISAFFVHDLKNAASSLNLMLKNLPVHFDDPVFREDALRAIGNTARRIDDMIGRLTALRQKPDFKLVEADLNQLVSEALETLGPMPQIELTKELQPLPRVLAAREPLQSVVTNLVLNARDALAGGGCIRVQTQPTGSSVVLTVADNGCGMSAAFLKDSLFRPFQTTKKKGLGIGMFQTRMIVEAHGGSIRVESEAGRGSTFRVSLPAKM